MSKTQNAFTLIEISITLAIVAILAATALPVYWTFVRRAKAMEVCRALKEGKPVLVGHFQEEGTFGGLTIAVAGDHYQFLSPAGFQLNAPVPNTESHITSLVAAATPTVLKVDWVFDPAFCENCDGTWCISCSEDGTCDIGQLFDDSWLKLNRGLDCNSI